MAAIMSFDPALPFCMGMLPFCMGVLPIFPIGMLADGLMAGAVCAVAPAEKKHSAIIGASQVGLILRVIEISWSKETNMRRHRATDA